MGEVICGGVYLPGEKIICEREQIICEGDYLREGVRRIVFLGRRLFAGMGEDYLQGVGENICEEKIICEGDIICRGEVDL